MLNSIEIKNFIFIKQVKIYLDKGFNVITGETGAGKSIFLSALALTLGERIPPDIIKSGEDEAVVESIFDLSKKPRLRDKFKKKLVEAGVNYFDEKAISIKRIIQSNKKSKCLICNFPVTVKDLKRFSKNLIDIHSQHQNLNLLNSNFYISYLDRFLNLEENLLHYRESYKNFLDKKKLLIEKEEELAQLKEEKGYLEFMIKELSGKTMLESDYETAKKQLQDYELEEKHQNNIKALLWQLKEDLYPLLNELNLKLKKVTFSGENEKKKDGFIQKNLKIINYFSNLEEFIQTQKKFLPYQEKINELNNQLSEIERLKRKYQVSLNQLDEKLKQAEQKLSTLKKIEGAIKDYKTELKKILYQCTEVAIKLHLKRKSGIPDLEKKIMDELGQLKMESSKISFAFEREQLIFEKTDDTSEQLNASGFDKIDFHYAASGESKLKPLKDIASGGEISRIMLAFKSILSQKLANNTIVFDEIDAGIGGETAIKIGEKIKELAKDKQIIIITHLPQIAKFADTHFKVEKTNLEKTFVEVRKLQEEEIIKEISRMLGNSKSEASQILAKEYTGLG